MLQSSCPPKSLQGPLLQQEEIQQETRQRVTVCAYSNTFDLSRLLVLAENFKAGNARHCVRAWCNVTSDVHVLSTIGEGRMINFLDKMAPPTRYPFEYLRSVQE